MLVVRYCHVSSNFWSRMSAVRLIKGGFHILYLSIIIITYYNIIEIIIDVSLSCSKVVSSNPVCNHISVKTNVKRNFDKDRGSCEK